MNYNFDFISSAEICKSLMADETTIKNKLQIRRNQRLNAMTNGSTASEQIPALIEALQAQVEAKQLEISAATDPREVLELNFELHTLNADLSRQLIREGDFDERDQALLLLSIGKIERSIEESDAYIAALQARRAELMGGSPPEG